MAGQHAEIAGAGICGLTTALMLRRLGWSVTVHERSDEVREIGAGIALHRGAMDVLEHVQVAETILSQAVDIDHSQALLASGEVLASRPLEGTSQQVAIRRPLLIRILADAAHANGVEVRTDSRVTGATSDGTLSLDSGETRRADLVVGADGFHSAVRGSLRLAAVRRFRTNGASRAIIEWPNEIGNTILREFWGAKNRVGLVPVSATETYVYMSGRESQRRGTAIPVDVDYWSSKFPGIDREVFERISRCEDSRHDQYPYVKARRWSAGRVAIVGDALNALPPTLGLGVSLGLRNARLMVEQVQVTNDVAQALKSWEARARPDSTWIQRWSLLRERMSHNLPAPLSLLRARVLTRSNGFRGWSRTGRSFDEALLTEV